LRFAVHWDPLFAREPARACRPSITSACADLFRWIDARARFLFVEIGRKTDPRGRTPGPMILTA
jgi:hypothetical protein